MRAMVSDWMSNWRILLSPGLSLYCLHWPEGASADAAQRMHNRSFITTCSQKKNPWTAKPFSWIKNQQQWKDLTICRWWQSVCWRGSTRRWWTTLFFSILFFKIAFPRSHGKSSGELAQYNAQACWRRRGADQSLLCPLNHFFKRVRGQVKLHFLWLWCFLCFLFYRTRVRSLGMLVTYWVTNSLLFSKLDWCDPGMWRWQVKLVEVVTVAHVDDEKRVDNSLVQIWQVKLGPKVKFC